jgi:hypothetical protein
MLIFGVIFVSVVNAEEEQSFNPADLTEAASHIELMPEYNQLTDGNAKVIRLVYDVDWAAGKYSVTVEAPYGWLDFDDGAKEDGFGDIRTRFFWKFYDAPESRLENMVFNLDAFLPTGDSDKGLGLGTYLIVPSVIFALPFGERFTWYPVAKYKFSTSKTEGRSSAFPPGKTPLPDREDEEYIHALELEFGGVYQLTEANAWILLAPIYEYDLEPEPDEENYELTLRGQIGKMFGRWGLGLEGTGFLSGEKSQDYQLRAQFFYYF